MTTVPFELGDMEAAAGSDPGRPAVPARKKSPTRASCAATSAPALHVSPYDALTAALLNLYEEVSSGNRRRMRRGSAPEHAIAVASVERILVPDLLSEAIALDPGCRVRVRMDVTFKPRSALSASRGRLGTVVSVAEDGEVAVKLDPTGDRTTDVHTYQRHTLLPVVDVNGDVLRAVDAIRPNEAQTAAMMQALNAELGAGRVSPDMARRLLIAANVALNQNPAAGVVTRD
ncbi:hypothetical protein [Paraburkholderia fungorum]|uniref:Uncharacterized protein n=1 Tax=Paraburkholderia fungorum TaxID=134537 RepID=A0AAW3V482_9BURK|nr:hypothetical protein [Paraburkholderia fungorum]MBB4517404.1 hypothetical protein [Paraburkholderia fungorum]MBB6204472.1 hypothetical protein [Paraburkholderia fungorum]